MSTDFRIYRPLLRAGLKVQDPDDLLLKGSPFWEIESVQDGVVRFLGRDGLWPVENFWTNFDPILLAPAMRLQERAAGPDSPVYLISAAMGSDWYRLAGWREDRSLTSAELWERFDLLDNSRVSRLTMLEFLQDSGIDHLDAAVYSLEELQVLVPEAAVTYPPRNDYIPTDDEIRRVHSDPSLWSNPGDSLASFERWLAHRDARIYAEARRDIEEELGIEPTEESWKKHG